MWENSLLKLEGSTLKWVMWLQIFCWTSTWTMRMTPAIWAGAFWEPKLKINSFTFILYTTNMAIGALIGIIGTSCKAKQNEKWILTFLLIIAFLMHTGGKPRFELQIGFTNLLSLSSCILTVVSPIWMEKSLLSSARYKPLRWNSEFSKSKISLYILYYNFKIKNRDKSNKDYDNWWLTHNRLEETNKCPNGNTLMSSAMHYSEVL